MAKMQPNQRQLYLRGQMDGERGSSPQGFRYQGDDREVYERGYGRGYDVRYRAEMVPKRHGNMGHPRPRQWVAS